MSEARIIQFMSSIKKLETKSGTKLGYWKGNIKMTLQLHVSKTPNIFGSMLNQKLQRFKIC